MKPDVLNRKNLSLAATTMLLLIAALFVWKLADLGWLRLRDEPPVVVQLRHIDVESYKLTKKEWGG